MTANRHFFAFAACVLLLGASCALDQESVDTSQSALTSVSWTSFVGVDAVDNNLTKTGTQGWNAGAVSIETVNDNSYVEFTTAEDTTSKMAGLSFGDDDVSFADIDFAIFLSAAGSVYVYEGGVNKGKVGTYAADDVMRVEVVSGAVHYLKNGSELYASLGIPSFPLLVDTSLHSVGATINNVELGDYVPPTFWQNAGGVSVSVDNNLTKTAAQGWGNAGASTLDTVTIDSGYGEFTTAETNTAKFAGLGNGDAGLGYAEIDFAFYLTAGGNVQIWEEGVKQGGFGTYSAGDVFRVSLDNGTVSYLQNDETLYVSGAMPTLPLRLDTALFSVGATIQDVSVVDVPYFQNVVGVSAVDDDLTKTGSQGWNAGASTSASFSTDAYTEFTTAEADTAKMAGLSVGDANQGISDIDFAIYLTSSGKLYIYENGVNRGLVGTYVATDVLRVENIGGTVFYRKNAGLLYQSLVAPTGALGFDSTMFTVGATIENVTVAEIPPYFQNQVGVSVLTDDLTKTGPAGWNSGASTSGSLAADGYVEFTTAEANTAKMAGLSNGDTGQSFGEIDFAIYLTSSGKVYIYENGVNRGLVGTYAADDVFSVENVGGVVTYFQNNLPLAGSMGVVTSPLRFDCSMYTNGATLNDIVLTDIITP